MVDVPPGDRTQGNLILSRAEDEELRGRVAKDLKKQRFEIRNNHRAIVRY